MMSKAARLIITPNGNNSNVHQLILDKQNMNYAFNRILLSNKNLQTPFLRYAKKKKCKVKKVC